MSRWVRYRFQHLRRWREYAEKVARAAVELIPGARVYIVGSVAEGHVTVLSDIDILVVVPRGAKRRSLSRDILLKAIEEHDLPFDAPVEVHVVEEGEEEEYIRGPHIRIR